MVAIAIGRDQGRIGVSDNASGGVYLVRCRRTEEALSLLETQADAESDVLLLTRTFPEKLPVLAQFQTVDHYWLTNLVGEKRIAPASLGRIISIARSHTESAKRSIIFIEGIEYLILENDFNSVLKSLNQVCDIALNSSSTLLISVDPEALSHKEIAMIERTCSATVLETGTNQF